MVPRVITAENAGGDDVDDTHVNVVILMNLMLGEGKVDSDSDVMNMMIVMMMIDEEND